MVVDERVEHLVSPEVVNVPTPWLLVLKLDNFDSKPNAARDLVGIMISEEKKMMRRSNRGL